MALTWQNAGSPHLLFEAEWQHCSIVLGARTGQWSWLRFYLYLTEMKKKLLKGWGNRASALSAPFKTFHCCYCHRKHQIALCSKATTKLTINMSLTPYTGIFSRLPPAPNIMSGPSQARLKPKVCCQSTMFSGLWCDSHANNRYLLLKMCYAIKLFSVICFELMYNLGSAFLLLFTLKKVTYHGRFLLEPEEITE